MGLYPRRGNRAFMTEPVLDQHICATDDTVLLKMAAMEEIKSLVDARSRLFDEHTHMFRWLTASLLAINAGAAVAALNSDFLSAHSKIVSGGFFGCGLLAALLVGVLGQKLNKKLLPVVQRQIAYWITVADDGERWEEQETELAAEVQAAIKWAWTVPAIGWVSALIFLAGIASMGLGLIDQEQRAKNVQSVQLNR